MDDRKHSECRLWAISYKIADGERRMTSHMKADNGGMCRKGRHSDTPPVQ